MSATPNYRNESEIGATQVNDIVHRSKAVLQCRWDHLRRLRWLGFVLMVILYSGALASQSTTADQDLSKPLRFDLTPLVGYRTSMLFPTGHPALISSWVRSRAMGWQSVCASTKKT